MTTINAFSLFDVVGIITGTLVMLLFLHRSLRVTRRGIDFLFTFVVSLSVLYSFSLFMSDNVVPTGVPADAVPDGARRTLFWYRFNYIVGTVFMASLTHFALRFSGSQRLRGTRTIALYIASVLLVPLYFSDLFLAVPSEPIAETSSFFWAVPWQPKSGPLISVFLLVWIAVNIFIQHLLRPRPFRLSSGFRRQEKIVVWFGVTLWGVGATASILAAALGYAGIDFNVIGLTISMIALAIGLMEEFRNAEEDRKKLKTAFEKYLSPEMASQVVSSRFNLSPGGVTRRVTAMMTDIEGFSTLSETMSGEDLSRMLIEYFSELTGHVFARSGTVVQFVGDAMYAVWGAPLDQPRQTQLAVTAALGIQDAVKQKSFHGRRLKTRIGISTGEALCGNLGSAARFDYAVIGDNTNLAARIEKLNKVLRTDVLLADSTARELNGDCMLREIGDFYVAGRSQPTRLWEPLSGEDGTAESSKFLASFSQGLNAWRAGDSAAATAHFRAALELRGDRGDGPTEVYLQRMQTQPTLLGAPLAL